MPDNQNNYWVNHNIFNLVNIIRKLIKDKSSFKQSDELFQEYNHAIYNIKLSYIALDNVEYFLIKILAQSNIKFQDIQFEDVQKAILNLFSSVKYVTFNFISEDGNTIFSDKIILQRIMFNLVKNAIEAGDSKKTITIVLNSYPDKYLISINNPKYIPENIQDRILKDIFTTKKKGSGVRLHCTMILVEKYLGCHIYFTSNIESGTIFSVYLQT